MKKIIILFACYFISSVCFANEKASLAIYPAYGSNTACLNNYLACVIVLRPDPSAPPGVFMDAIITNNSQTVTALNIIVEEAPPIAGVLPAPFNAESKVVYIPTTNLPSVPACYTLPNNALLPKQSCSIRFASSSSSFQQVSGTLTIKGSNTSPIHVTLEVISAD